MTPISDEPPSVWWPRLAGHVPATDRSVPAFVIAPGPRRSPNQRSWQSQCLYQASGCYSHHRRRSTRQPCTTRRTMIEFLKSPGRKIGK